jgi:hypothetical protein
MSDSRRPKVQERLYRRLVVAKRKMHGLLVSQLAFLGCLPHGMQLLVSIPPKFRTSLPLPTDRRFRTCADSAWSCLRSPPLMLLDISLDSLSRAHHPRDSASGLLATASHTNREEHSESVGSPADLWCLQPRGACLLRYLLRPLPSHFSGETTQASCFVSAWSSLNPHRCMELCRMSCVPCPHVSLTAPAT